jgi:ribosomal protein S18 acetylase RimI-like enzyme
MEVKVAMELVDDVVEKQARSEYRVHVLEESGRLAGYVCYGQTALTEASYALYWMAVEREFEKHGCERSLLRFVDEEVQRLGATLLSLETSSLHSKRTATIYKRNGYRIVARIKDFYRDGDDKLIFIKEFCPSPCEVG